jgi:hypothetical protein
MIGACGAPQPLPPIVVNADDIRPGPDDAHGGKTFVVSGRWMLARLRIEQQLEADLAACRDRE